MYSERPVITAQFFRGYVVYALLDPSDLARVRYVGVSNAPLTRYEQHCRSTGGSVAEWVRSLDKTLQSPVMVLLEHHDRSDFAKRAERRWIREYRALGQADLNTFIPKGSV